MKNSLVFKTILFSGVLFLMACNSTTPESQEAVTETLDEAAALAQDRADMAAEAAEEASEAFADITISKSETHFDNAIIAFEGGKMDEVVVQLKEGITALSAEGIALEGEELVTFKTNLKKLMANLFLVKNFVLLINSPLLQQDLVMLLTCLKQTRSLLQQKQ